MSAQKSIFNDRMASSDDVDGISARDYLAHLCETMMTTHRDTNLGHTYDLSTASSAEDMATSNSLSFLQR